ncbi:ABC transporter permease [Mycoplasmoides pneumoniae]|uniref:ABC transporter permease n=1 Tax=Mycoplasmoides pneumoniae TaxID=2104 RepID=UPI0013756AF7|nr:ABC transporter permease [Mycoplasmoides pneumoniae]QHR21751.1 FtsX-like permease family protein [Mycoplasmoides pneumoniae]QHR22454.1 FtsX-like permease family protein [Mycoplasmoides pneumoniae]QHR23157.1 FtsX-like permease family protein [Mycoplasmoides pneumoniae]QHR23858.1 FtsX-like permease family protein [Mycoplasmoides pneumoniae]
MFSFFKQIFKSLKKFFFLLFGIIFVLFSIIFLETSILQLSNNLVNTYTALVQKTNSSDIVAPAIFKESSPVYKTELKEEKRHFSKIKLTEKKINFIWPYQESDFGSDSEKKDSTTKSSDNNPRKGDVNDKDKLFLARKRGILKAYGEANIAEKRIYKGLAVSFQNTYSFTGTDQESNNLNQNTVSDPQNLIYDKEGNLLGYFVDGLILDGIPLRAGIARFPGDKGKGEDKKTTKKESEIKQASSATTVLQPLAAQAKMTDAKETTNNEEPKKDSNVEEQYTTNNKDKVWFKSDETQAGSSSGESETSKLSTSYLFTGGQEAANWFPNLYANVPIVLPISPGSQFWLETNPFKEIIEVFQKEKEEKEKQSFSLTFTLDTSKLSHLDKEEFDWLEKQAETISSGSSFGDYNLKKKINSLKSFELNINKDWLKNKVKAEKETILDSLPGFSNSDKNTIFSTQSGDAKSGTQSNPSSLIALRSSVSFKPQLQQTNVALAQQQQDKQESSADDGVKDPTFSDVQTEFDKIGTENHTPQKNLNNVYAALLHQWKSIFQEDLVKKVTALLEKYRDAFLKAKALKELEFSRQNLAIATNVSSEESASFLVSNKDSQKYNDLSIIEGINFKSWLAKEKSNPLDMVYGGKSNSEGFLEKVEYEFKPTQTDEKKKAAAKTTQGTTDSLTQLADASSSSSSSSTGNTKSTSTKFQIYPKLANILAQAQLPEASSIPDTLTNAIKQWSTLDKKGFEALDDTGKSKAANNYVALLSYFTPEFQDPNELVVTNRQKLDIPIIFKNGVNPLTLPTDQQSLVVQTPEAHGAVVSQQWLFKHDKEVLPLEGEYSWKEALENPKNLPNWLNDLPDKYKFSINGLTFAILGVGESVETGYPVLSTNSPLPNSQDEGLIFLNEQGYRSVLFAVPAASEENYYAFKSDDIKAKFPGQDPIQVVASKLKGYLNVPDSDLAFNVKDISKFQYLTTARNYFPDLVQNYLAIASVVIAAFLSILALYLTILLIKSFIKKNQTEFSIIRAGGFSTAKFIAGMSVFAGIVALASSFFGVLFAFLLERQVKGIISRYWFIALPANSFNWISFFGSMLLIFVIFQFISWIAFKQLFSKPVNVLIDQGNETKFSVFLHLLKRKSYTMTPLGKFRVSLIISRLSRLFTYVGLSSIALLLIGIAGTIPQKFGAAQSNTVLNRNFNYRLNLQTPTEQSGWYAIQPYSRFGQTDDSLGIKALYKDKGDQIQQQQQQQQQQGNDKEHPYNLKELKISDRGGNPIKHNGKEIELGNLLLPSFGGAQQLNTDENFFRHASLSKWLIDFPIRVGGANINPWEIVEKSIPKQITQLLSASSDQFLIAVLTDDYFNNLNNNGFLTRNPRTNFIQLDAARVLTQINVFNPGGVKFNEQFLKFLTKVYGDPELSYQDSKLTYGIVPVDPQIEETYTYVQGPFGFKETELNPDSPYTLTGISPDSKFVNLTDSGGNSLRSLISSDSEMNVIVNAGFQYANNTKIGDFIFIQPKNTATRYSEKFLKSPPKTPTVKFRVVGVSTDAFGQELYINQNIANRLLKLNGFDGRGVIKDVVKDGQSTDDSGGTSSGGGSCGGGSTSSTTKDKYKIEYVKPTGYVPFNGVFSKELNPSLVSKALVLNSNIGVWGNFTDFGNNFTNLVKGKENKIITSILPSDPDILKQLAKEKGENGVDSMTYENLRKKVIEKYTSEWSSTQSLASGARGIFGDNIMVPALKLDAAGASAQIIRNNAEVLFNTVNQVDGFLLGTIIPFIFITCVVLGISMLEEMKRIFISLKSIGYKDSQNLVSLLCFFIPAFVLSLLISIAILAGLLVGVQALVFGVAQVFLTNVFEFLPYMVGIVLFGATIFVIGSYFWIKLRSAELKEGF